MLFILPNIGGGQCEPPLPPQWDVDTRAQIECPDMGDIDDVTENMLKIVEQGDYIGAHGVMNQIAEHHTQLLRPANDGGQGLEVQLKAGQFRISEVGCI